MEKWAMLSDSRGVSLFPFLVPSSESRALRHVWEPSTEDT